MVRCSALMGATERRLPAGWKPALQALALLACAAIAAHAVEIPKPTPKPDDKNAKPAEKDKGAGPEHNVTLMEEPGVKELFNKAAKARARAENEPEAWPDCVKAYSDILKKYPNTVYLDKWEGPDKALSAYKNGLYKSTRERVFAEIASLPPAALAVYRITNDPPARALFIEGQEQFDPHKMEQVARDYFATMWSNDALGWLGESAYEHGAWRDAAEWLRQAAANPGKNSTPLGLMVRETLALARAGNKDGAAKTLDAVIETMKDPAKGALRLGHDEGDAALAKLRAQVEALAKSSQVAESTETGNQIATYFGNATHTQLAQARPGRGLRKWSVRIDDLLYGKNAVPADAGDHVTSADGMTNDTSMNQQLTIKDGYFYINDGQVYAAYPAGNPVPGGLAAGGNAKYMLPQDGVKNPPKHKQTNRNQNQFDEYGMPVTQGVSQHPYFATLAGDRAYGVLGAESIAQLNAMQMRIRFGGMNNENIKPVSNYLVCFGRAENAKETSILWSLKSGEPAFVSQSKAEQEWLKTAYFVSSPTYESGVLYVAATVITGTCDAWAAAFDAENGRLLWRTQICTANPIVHNGSVQPDRGLPVAVANRTVYVVTNLGAVAALDAGGGSVKWIRVYDRTPAPVNQNWGNGIELAPNPQFWAPNPPLVYKNRLIVTPQDSELIYCYDIDTGARVWEKNRVANEDEGDTKVAGNVRPPAGSYRHVLGILNGALVLSGTDIFFLNALTGQILTDPITLDSPIKGRGALAPNMVLVSTEKNLARIDVTVESVKEGTKEVLKAKVGAPQYFKWDKPAEEAGSVYAAGGVLYTVSHSHVNAYILWEELEAKLKEQLKTQPDDVQARIELADVYKSIERFDETLAQLETARASAEKSKGPKSDDALQGIRQRKFETLMALGAKSRMAGKTSEAAERFKQAYDTAASGEGADVLPVLALKAKAELYDEAGRGREAAQTYQEILAKHGNVVIQEQNQSTQMARLYAQMRLAELKAKDPSSYAAIDAEAKAALADAGNDPGKLKTVIANYPNSEHSGAALLALARVELEKSPDRARLDATRYLSRFRGGAPEAGAQALALLATACERLNLMGPAHSKLTQLAGEEFKDATISLKGIDEKALPGGGVVSAREWAAARLEEPLYKRAPSEAVFSMGGKLKDDEAWKKPNGENTVLLAPDGIPPVEMRRAVFCLENATELSAISGRDGTELWKPRPAAPANAHGRAFWWERLLIVCGDTTLTAYDSSDNGKIAWTAVIKIDPPNSTGYWSQIAGDRIVVSYGSNVLQVFDAASGAALWKSQLPAQMTIPPICGEGIVVIALANSNKLSAYNLDTGASAWPAGGDVLELAVSNNANNVAARVSPVISGERVIVAMRPSKLRVLDLRTGKPAGKDIEAKGTITGLRASGDLALCLLDNREIAAYRTEQNPGEAWQPLLGPGVQISDFFVDGDDLLVFATSAQNKSDLAAYSIKGQGKMKWKQEVAFDALQSLRQPGLMMRQQQGQIIVNGGMVIQGGGRMIVRRAGGGVMIMNGGDVEDGAANFAYGTDGGGGWLRENAARDQILIVQSGWEATGVQPKIATLIDRATGKSVWNTTLKVESPSDTTPGPARVQLFDGGLVLSDAHERRSYVALTGAGEEEIKEIAEEAAKNPANIDARIKLAAALYAKGEHEKALTELSAVLSDPKTSDSSFADAYKQFALLRKDFSQQNRTQLVFQHVEKAPDVAGGVAGWENVPEKVLDSWRDVYLASEDLNSRSAPKKDMWKGPDDVKAAFKGAYDEKNLYIQVTVRDDVQRNEHTEGAQIDFGDSLVLAFDIGLDRGALGYRGEAFELSLGLAKGGKAVGWRRVEHARYTRGVNAIEKDFSVTRKDADHSTLYQIALPLDYLGVKPDAGAKFGFTFAVHDQDAGALVDKSICPSPGLIGSREPRYFSLGVLNK
ncbi:MAG TPA: tetratricopeptide repeat protein [Planctomycetota bacterium]|nr:tetratricopeptide repeat protein [Planctomycetota bacterium]